MISHLLEWKKQTQNQYHQIHKFCVPIVEMLLEFHLHIVFVSELVIIIHFILNVKIVKQYKVLQIFYGKQMKDFPSVQHVKNEKKTKKVGNKRKRIRGKKLANREQPFFENFM